MGSEGERVRGLLLESTYLGSIVYDDLFEEALAQGVSALDLDELTEVIFSIPWDPLDIMLHIAGDDEDARRAALVEVKLWLCDSVEISIRRMLPEIEVAAPEWVEILRQCMEIARKNAAGCASASEQEMFHDHVELIQEARRSRRRAISRIMEIVDESNWSFLAYYFNSPERSGPILDMMETAVRLRNLRTRREIRHCSFEMLDSLRRWFEHQGDLVYELHFAFEPDFSRWFEWPQNDLLVPRARRLLARRYP